MKILTIILSVAFVLFSEVSFGQRVLTLEECISIAQKNSLNIKKAFLSEKESLIEVKFAKQQMLPSLNANSSLSYNIGRRIDPVTNTYISQSFLSQGINLNTGVMLYNGNSVRNRIKKALTDKKATMEDIDQMKRDIALMVTNTYLSILFAQENLNNSKTQYKSTHEQLDKMNKFVDAGLKPSSATLNLEAQLLSDDQKVITGQNSLEKNYLNLKNILLLEDSERIMIKIPNINISDLDEFTSLSLREMYISSLQHHPGYSAAEYRIKSAHLLKEISKASLLPSLSIGGGLSTSYTDIMDIVGYGKQLENNLGIGVAMQVNIPIFNKYSGKAQIQRAKLGVESAEISKEQLSQEIRANIQTAIADSKAAKSQYFATRKAFDAQMAAFENAKKLYEVGSIGSYDFLNAKLLYEQSENNLLISKYQYIFKTKIIDFYLGENLTFK